MTTRPLGSTRERSLRRTLHGTAAALITSSLLLYLAAIAAQRTWALLNSDIGQLIRRLH